MSEATDRAAAEEHLCAYYEWAHFIDAKHIMKWIWALMGLRQAVTDTQVRHGWIRYMRKAFGMKIKDLARLTSASY